MLLTRWHGPGRGVAVGPLVPFLEASGNAVLGVVPATVAPAATAAHERAQEREEQEQAEDREQEAERVEAPAVRVAVVRDRRDDRCAAGRGGDDLHRATLGEAGLVRARGDRAADQQSEDDREGESHRMSSLFFLVAHAGPLVCSGREGRAEMSGQTVMTTLARACPSRRYRTAAAVSLNG